jgi:hypothetical protein
MRGQDSATLGSLHVFTLVAFAVAQPLYDLLGRNPDFLVARRAGAADVLLLVLCLSFVLPALLAGLLLVPLFRQLLYQPLLTVLVAATALPVLKRIKHLHGWLLPAAAVLIALAFALGYRRWRPLRLLLTAASPAVLVFPALFLANPQVRKLLRPADAVADTQDVKAVTPIVLVVFDEFPLSSLLNERREIDATAYPHFAELAREATWLRSATAAHPWTACAVPAILTGCYAATDSLPTRADHPRNLFTLFGRSHELRVFEPLTQLCPGCPCGTCAAAPAQSGRLTSLLGDLGLLELHMLLPRSWAGRLPPVAGTWQNPAAQERPGEDRPRQFERFLDAIQPSSRPGVYFLHVLLPHGPFCFLPSGKCYARDSRAEGLSAEGVWTDEELANQAYQRHLLQVAFVDRLLGRLVDRLKEVGLYDRAVLVVTADHGISFRPGEPYRAVTPGNFPDVMRVPLLIRLPGQREGIVSDRRVQAIDILPTIAEAVGVRLPWPVDGRPALDPAQPEWSEQALYDKDKRFAVGPDLTSNYGSLDRKVALFGTGHADGFVSHGPYRQLVGRRVSELDVSGPADVTLQVRYEDLLREVSPQSGFVPALIQGSARPSRAGLTLAVAVNGIVQAVTRTVSNADEAGQWSAMVPEAAFGAGRNTVEVFVVSSGSDGRLRLERATPAAAETGIVSRLAASPRSGKEVLLAAGGREIMVVPGVVQGCLDRAQIDGGSLELAGWAADARHGELPEAVVVLADGTVCHAGPVSCERRDVAEALKQPGLRQSGFSFVVPLDQLRRLGNPELRVFAVSRRGVASELQYPAWYVRQGRRPAPAP